MRRCCRLVVAVATAVLGTAAVPAQQGAATSPAPMVGRLHIVGAAFHDDRGPVLPVYAHAGDLLAVFIRDAPRALAELDAVARAGYHGLRVWAALGCTPSEPCPERGADGTTPYWRGRELGPQLTADYYGHVERFFAAVAARRLRLVWSLGDVQVIGDRRDFMTRVAALDRAAGVLDWIDCGNEAWQTGEDDPAQLAACVGYYQAAGGRALKTLTSPPGEDADELNAYSIDPADAFDVHAYRGGHSWDKRRHIAALTRSDRPPLRRPVGISSEPPGSGALVSVTEHIDELDEEAVALMGAAALIARQAFVWFSGEGVRLDRGLATAAGFAAVPKVAALLPRDVMTYDTRHHSGAAFATRRVLEAQGQVRIDGAIAADGRFAYTIDGPPGRYALTVARAFEARLCHPATAVCEPVSKAAGDTLTVSFTRGRLLIGRAR